MRRNKLRVRNLKRQKCTDIIFTVAKSYDIASSGESVQHALCKINPQLNCEIWQIAIQVSIAGQFDSVLTQTQISNHDKLNRCYFKASGSTIDFGNDIENSTGILLDRFEQFEGNKKDYSYRLPFPRAPIYFKAGSTIYVHSWTDCTIAGGIGILTKAIFYAGRLE